MHFIGIGKYEQAHLMLQTTSKSEHAFIWDKEGVPNAFELVEAYVTVQDADGFLKELIPES